MRRPDPGRILAAVRARLAGARYVAADVLFVSGRFVRRLPGAIGRGVATFWRGLATETRRRLAAALGLVVVVVLVAVFAVPNLPCEFPGGDACPPPDDAEELVPSDALAYVHADLDPDSEQYREAADAVAGLPVITQQIVAQVLAVLPGPAGSPSDFEADIDPWFGNEAALAAVPGRGGGAQQVQLLEVDDGDAASEFARRLATGRARAEDYRGIELRVDRRGLATAQVEGFVVVGLESGVRAIVDTATGAEGSRSLADDEAARDARDELPSERFAEAYVSPEGAAKLIARSTGTLDSLAPFVAPDSTRGAAAALSASEGELELAVRSVLDPDLGRAQPGFFSAFAPFEPRLAERLSSASLAYLGVGNPERTVKALLAQASASAPGIATGFDDLFRELRRNGEIDLERELLPALGAEGAFVLAPPPDEPVPDPDTEAEGEIPPPPGEAPPPPEPAEGPTPYLEFVASDVDEDAARKALARLQGPVASAVDAAAGLQAPVFRELEVDDVTAQILRISPTIELTYAVFDALAVVATAPAAIEGLVADEGGLDSTALYERVTEGFPETLSMLAFLNLADLVSVAEQLGLAADPTYAAFAPEIRALSALGVAVETDSDLLATDARLVVEPPPD